ncbi:MAG: glycoside hydrolase family 2 [Myxococcales bacterium]|nr:glycoside hydrolase family 2 [Myxococcales bacterium]
MQPLSLAGPWRVTPSYDPATRALPVEARPMTVPSNWYQQGWDQHGALWFARAVELPAGAAAWRLELDAVDYQCDVFWDGQRLGSHTGYFAPFSFTVPNTSGAHVLAIRVDSPLETARNWSLHKTQIKGVLSHHDTRPGGAWSADGQDASTGGIWGGVRLAPAQTAWIDRPRVTTLRASAATAELQVTAEVTPLGAAPAAVRWHVTSPIGATVASGDWTGRGRLEVSVTVRSPQLWWPREHGAAPLYKLHLSAGADRAATRFGIRTVVRDDNSRYRINGVPVFLRGTNYIGSLYLATLDRAVIQRDLDLMLRANINAVRVHAHVTSPAFYDLADELGLLVWQDFPLQWGYDDSPAFAQEAARQLHDMLELLGGHPSVIHWTAQNEAPWSSEWMTYKYPLYDPDQNRHLSAVLSAVLATDPSRPSQVNSGSAEHAWMGWYSGSYRDFARPQAHPILTEFGAQALPTLTTLRTILQPHQLWPLDANLAAWEYRNFQKHELTTIAKVQLGGSVEALIANTQAYQARLIQFAAENLRRQTWQPVTGIFHFMFVEHWPSMNWGIVDYLRTPKPGFSALRRAYQPVLAMAYPYQKGALRLHVANDRSKPEDVLIVVTRELAGKITYRRRVAHRLRASAVSAVDGTLARPAANETLRLVVTDLRNTPLSENVYAPGYFAE